MSFKSSRFDILKEGNSGVNNYQNNGNKNYKKRDRDFGNRDRNRDRDREKRSNFSETILKPPPPIELFNENDFPTLGDNKSHSKGSLNKQKGYKERLQKEVETDSKEELPNGWIELNKKIDKQVFKKVEEIPLSEEEIYNIFNKLCDRYEDYTNNYIKRWGLDEYERMFLFPNYDYNYFDKLDEEYNDYIEDLERQEAVLQNQEVY